MSSFRYSAASPNLTIEAVAREIHSDLPRLAAKSRYQFAKEIVDILSELIDDPESYEWTVDGELSPRTDEFGEIANSPLADSESSGMEPAKLFLRFTARNGHIKKFFRRMLEVEVPHDLF
jgi:hypothetical protein